MDSLYILKKSTQIKMFFNVFKILLFFSLFKGSEKKILM